MRRPRLHLADRRLRRLALLALLLLLPGCPEEPGLLAQATIPAASGGMLSYPGDADRPPITLEVPPDALAQDTLLSIEGATPVAVPALHTLLEAITGIDQTGLLGAVVELGPDGTQFDPPATLRIGYDPMALPAGVDPTFLTLVEVEDDGTYSELVGVEVDTDNAMVSGETFSLSRFVITDGTTLAHAAPVADPGPSQSVAPGRLVILDGSGSSDDDGDPLVFAWALEEGPPGSSAVLSDPSAVRPTFTADLTGTYRVSLFVSDGMLRSLRRNVEISTSNSAPRSDAGPDRTVDEGALVTLDGSDFADADGDRLSLLWELAAAPEGSTASLSDVAALRPSFTADLPGDYYLTVVASDASRDGPADVAVVSTLDSVPAADAGSDTALQVGVATPLRADATTDADGDRLSYAWSLVSAPAGSTASIEDADSVLAKLTPDVPGTFVAQVVVSDGLPGPSFDTVLISSEGLPPVAAAGPDQHVTVGGLVSLDGSDSSDPDGDGLTYAWSLLSTPAASTASLSGADGAVPSFTADLAGTYVVQLLVDDGTSVGAADTVVVSTVATRPRADAGADAQVDAGTRVTLDGSGSVDPEGAPLAFRWSMLAWPEAGQPPTLDDPEIDAPSFFLDAPGAYVAQLEVDDGVLSHTDTVLITTSPIPPVADAGPDQTVIVGDTVTLDGSGSVDREGLEIVSYAWSLAAPDGSTASLSDPTAVAPTFVADLAGTYTASLIVDNGAVASDANEAIVLADLDGDGDGVVDGQDCESGNEDVYPGNVEVCGNAVDEDCTGEIDDLDLDRDGFSAAVCGGDDLDDANPFVGIRELELCEDAVDNDGDGVMDGDDPACAFGCDTDGDGHPSVRCGGFDIVDDDPSAFPNAAEVCGDFVDNDQDGLVDEECVTVGIAFGPDDAVVPSGQSLFTIVLDSEDRTIDWEYLVNGVPGGSAELGTLIAFEADTARAFYRAPEVTQTLAVTLRAQDPANPTNTFDTAPLTVVPFESEPLVTPADPVVGLGTTRRFEAKVRAGGVDGRPLRNVFWRVNGQLGGNRVLGTIDADGIYEAPPIMPAPLPVEIEVGFSFLVGGPTIATTEVVLARLEATPDSFASATEGPVGVVTASLETSDAQVVVVPVGDLRFRNLEPEIASAAANGTVSIGAEVGRTWIEVLHAPTGAGDDVRVDSVLDLLLTADAIPVDDEFVRTVEDANGGEVEIEFTRPEALFQLRPRYIPLRGSITGDELSGVASPDLVITADGTNVVAYDPLEGLIEATGKVAIVNSRTGEVEIGDVPGMGTITATYDNGFVQRQHTLEVQFSRLTIEISPKGVTSGGTTQVETTEYVDVTVTVRNGASDFVGETPIRFEVEHAEQDDFRIGYTISGFTGKGAFWTSNSTVPSQSLEGHRIVLPAPSTLDDKAFVPPGESKVTFRVTPGPAGPLTFRATAENDPVVTTEEIVDVERPELLADQCQFIGFAGTDGANDSLVNDRDGVPFMRTDTTPILVNSWNPMELSGSFGGPVTFERDGPFVWRISEGGVPVKTVPGVPHPTAATLYGDAPPLPVQGTVSVTVGPRDRDSMQTAPAVFDVVTPASVASVDVLPKTSVLGADLPRDVRLGSLEIVEVDGSWTPNEPVRIVLQTYSASGVPKSVGYRGFVIENPGTPLEEKRFLRDTVYGVLVADVVPLGPGIFPTQFYPADETGRIEFTVTPALSGSIKNDPDRLADALQQPFLLKLHPYLGIGLPPFAGQMELEIDFSQHENLRPDFVDKENFEGYLRPCIYIPGNGLAAYPRELPVPSPRVRAAVAASELEPRAEQTIFELRGTGPAFEAALANGLNALQTDTGLGSDISLVSSSVGSDSIALTTLIDPGAALGSREITVTFGTGDDEQSWVSTIELFQAHLDKTSLTADQNLPLNARPEGTEFPGTIRFDLQDGGGPEVEGLELTVHPSVTPFDEADPTAEAGMPQRGAQTSQPLVGFRRFYDWERNLSLVSGLSTLLSSGVVRVYGDSNDFRTLREPGAGGGDGVLDEPGQPDGQADFVSREVDAERLDVTLEGNWADVQHFTAYNVITRRKPLEALPTLEFHALKTGSMRDVYEAYSTTKLGGRNLGEGRLGESVGVFVDREVNSLEGLDGLLGDHLSGIVASNYWAGILDQYYQLESPDTYRRTPLRSLGRDGRVGGFDGEREGVATGTVRRSHFGIELDGVFYERDFFGTEEEPNAAELLLFPVVDGFPTPLGFVPDAGGTSGGFFDFPPAPSSAYFGGGHASVSKSPGQRAPGLIAGYLIQDRIEDYRTPGIIWSGVEDDLFRVAIKRGYEPTRFDSVGPPIQEFTGNYLDFDERRRLMSFSSDFDRKAPVTTASQLRTDFEITTDPPGLPPVRVKAVLHVSTLDEQQGRLSVTTQSDGATRIRKLLLDSYADLVTELVTTGILTAITGGGYLQVCGTGSGIELGAELMELGANLSTLAVYGDVQLPSDVLAEDGFGYNDFVYGVNVARNGVAIPGTEATGLKFGGKDLISVGRKVRDFFRDLEGSEKAFKWTSLNKARVVSAGENTAICKLAKLPFAAIKNEFKRYSSIERLGGNGSAEAQGIKGLMLSIPVETRLSEGTHNYFALQHQKAEVRPQQPDVVLLSDSALDQPGEQVSDASLIAMLEAAMSDPATRAEAGRLLDAIADGGLRREASEEEYNAYTLRSVSLSGMSLIVAPGQILSSGELAGDFAFTTDDTVVPVVSFTGTSVSRTNALGTARAFVHVGQVELRLLTPIILKD